MNRIVIIGPGAAGKSTFAIKLGKKLNISVHHLDSLYWKENWTKTEDVEWQRIQEELLHQPKWIIDGNYTKTFDVRFAAADTIFFLDFSKVLLVWRTLKRLWIYWGKTRPDMGGNNTERFNWDFLNWILTYPSHEVLNKLTLLPKDKKVIIFKKPKDLEIFLNDVH